MNTRYDFSKTGDDLVYIRAVQAEDLPAEIRDHAEITGEVYAIHGSNGACLGLAPNRQMAFHLARSNDLAPVSVH